MQALPKKTHHERNVPIQRILYEMLEVARSWLNEGSFDMEILKLIICTTILLGLVAAIMLVYNAWSDRIFIAYVAVAALAIVACIWLYD